MDATNSNFLFNNVKGLQISKKRLKLFNYFKNKRFPNGILFLQETHCTKETKLSGKTNLTVIYTFNIVNQIRVEY